MESCCYSENGQDPDRNVIYFCPGHVGSNLMYVLRPEVSQLYTLQTNKFKGSKNPVVYKSEGNGTIYRATDPARPVTQSTLGNEAAQLDAFVGEPISLSTSSRTRLSDCLCYVCKTRLGADNSQRIGIHINVHGQGLFIYI